MSSRVGGARTARPKSNSKNYLGKPRPNSTRRGVKNSKNT
jgi:hypothetical protein